jgi:hypothetical protein
MMISYLFVLRGKKGKDTGIQIKTLRCIFLAKFSRKPTGDRLKILNVKSPYPGTAHY